MIKTLIFCLLSCLAVFPVSANKSLAKKVSLNRNNTNNLISWQLTKSQAKCATFKIMADNECVGVIDKSGKIKPGYVLLPDKNGVYKVEAEDYEINGWEFSTEWNGFSGSGYMVCNRHYNNWKEELTADDKFQIPANEIFEITFNVLEAGNYKLDACFAMDNEESNDIWTRFTANDHHFHKSGRIFRADESKQFLNFSWTSGAAYLQPGIHKAWVAPRSKNLALDYIVIYKTEFPAVRDTTNTKRPYWLINTIHDSDRPKIESASPANVAYNSFVWYSEQKPTRISVECGSK